MTTMIEKFHAFKVRPPKGEDPNLHLDVPGVLNARRSKLGTLIVQLPPPYEDIEIAEYERVGAAKWQRITHAIADLKSRAEGR